MEEFRGEEVQVNARIIYWGVEGAGKTTNLRIIHAKLRADHRGDLESVPTRLDPTVMYSVLPIELGQVGGVRTRIQIVTVPGGGEHAPTRKQLLDEVDGVVFVVDTARDRVDENLASFEELRSSLADYGRALEDVPLVIQYNKRDEGDPYALEELHRKLSMSGVAAFEATATEGTAVLQTLTTISKRVIRKLRQRADDEEPLPESGVPAKPLDLVPADEPIGLEPEDDLEIQPAPPPDVTQLLDLEDPDPGLLEGDGLDPSLLATTVEDTTTETTARAESLFEASFQEATREPETALEALQIESVGQARKSGDRAVSVPLVVRDGSRSRRLTLTIQIEPEEELSP